MSTVDELTEKQLNQIWDDGVSFRNYVNIRNEYYNGDHSILKRNEKYTDGKKKANVVTNWVKYVVNRYVGAITNYQLGSNANISKDAVSGSNPETANTSIDENPESVDKETVDAGLQFYSELTESQMLDTVDIENRRSALISGSSIELHSFDGNENGGIKITRYNPSNWRILYNDDGTIFLAMYQIKFSAGEVYKNEFLSDEIETRVIYTSRVIKFFERRTGENKSGKWNLVEVVNHNYNRVPIVVWKIDENLEGIVSNAIMKQNDEYNEIDSIHGDSVKLDVDSLLKLTGVDADWVMSVADTIRDMRIIPLPAEEGADASYLVRTFDNERIELRLSRTRAHIHMMGEVPDVSKIVGATGGTSGIALKLMFTPMEESAKTMISFLKKGMIERIELINTIQELRKKPKIIFPKFTIQFRIPVNRIEEWMNIGAISGIVSHKTQLDLLTDITNADAELAMILDETETLESLNDIQEPPPGKEKELIERRAREVNAAADATIAGLEPLLTTLGNRISQAVSSGLSKAVNKQKKE